jgi:RNA polymerase sigma-70 factor (ECF subfamily)
MDLLASSDTLADWAEIEFRSQVASSALRLMQAEFPETTWRACWQYVALGQSPAEVAAELRISVEVVYQAKTRVLRRLREEFGSVLD